MKVKDSIIINYNEDTTITMYDFDSDTFYNFDLISTYIYNNFEKGFGFIFEELYNIYEVDKYDLQNDINEIIVYLQENIFE